MDDVELTVPPMVDWPIFPFEGDLRVRALVPRHETERLRNGDPGGEPCHRCHGESGEEPVWQKDNWAVSTIKFGDEHAGFPAYMLEIREHRDIDSFDEELAAELGVMTLRLQRAIMSLGTVGRVHFNRWGDGAHHFHVWFLGRPTGAWQFSGYTLPLWGFILPPLDDAVRKANDAAISAFLAELE